MTLYIVPEPAAMPLHLLVPIDPLFAGDAVNDSGVVSRPALGICDLNLLVASVVGDVTAQMQPERVNVGLVLTPNRPIVHGDSTELAFAISGIIGSQLRALEDADGGDLRVETRVEGSSVHLFIAGDDLPPIGFVRAVDPNAYGSGAIDPTLAHCRRLIERCGGRIELVERDGFIGFSVVLPTLPVSRPVHLLPLHADAIGLASARKAS
jgi:hypothetical protein